ncbi:MAG: YigZ family protein [Rhizobiaceae bacterium]|nr:YigZ family protein [Rhizobiaceae bacterium]
MLVLENIISDRGSRYAVSGASCKSADEVNALLKDLKRAKKFAKATHNSWGIICSDGPIKNDDGESGAGMIILQMLERENLNNHLIVVTRWYGGKHLGGDRFKHIKSAVRTYLDALNNSK